VSHRCRRGGGGVAGTIPAWQWNRDAPRIHFVFLHMNLLSGSIPWALTNTTMPYLEAVSVAYNAHLCGADPGMPHAPARWTSRHTKLRLRLGFASAA
jgi:hypothetical protein